MAETVTVNVTSAVSAYSTGSSNTAYDKVTGFTLGTDKVAIVDTDGTAQTFSVSTATAVNTANTVSANLVNGVVTKFVVGTGTATTDVAALDARIDTLAEIVAILDAQVTSVGEGASFVFGGNQYIWAQNGTADVLVELTGVTTGTALTAAAASVFSLA